MIFEFFALFIIFLCLGSFLNVVSYRLTHEQDFWTKRSYCPSCKTVLAWYDIIPIVSFLFSQGKCRYCGVSISPLYPLVEFFTALVCTMLYFSIPFLYFIPYVFYFSLLIISIRSDLEQMVISSVVTLYQA